MARRRHRAIDRASTGGEPGSDFLSPLLGNFTATRNPAQQIWLAKRYIATARNRSSTRGNAIDRVVTRQKYFSHRKFLDDCEFSATTDFLGC
jgi:hypothetical protein